jgi:hypothetical protein
MANNKPVVFCCICGCGIHEADFHNGTLADHIKRDVDGSIDYIELAHDKCARAFNLKRPGYFAGPVQ